MNNVIEKLKKKYVYVELSEHILKFPKIDYKLMYKMYRLHLFIPYSIQRIIDESRLPDIWKYHDINCTEPHYIHPKITVCVTNENFVILDGQHSLTAICRQNKELLSKRYVKNICFDLTIYLQHMTNDDKRKIYVNINQSVPVTLLELSKSDERKIAEESWKLLTNYFPIGYFSGKRNCRPPRLNKSRYMDEFDKISCNNKMDTHEKQITKCKYVNSIDIKNTLRPTSLTSYEKIINNIANDEDIYCYLGLIKRCIWLDMIFH